MANEQTEYFGQFCTGEKKKKIILFCFHFLHDPMKREMFFSKPIDFLPKRRQFLSSDNTVIGFCSCRDQIF